MEQTKLGFGFMRLPFIGDEIDEAECMRMIDAFLEAGFTYFDTAHGYAHGLSEVTLKHCLTSRYPRTAYTLTDKLTNSYFNSQEEILPLFEQQLEACGVTYFDYYLMHAQDQSSYEKYKACHAYETSLELLKEGRIRHFGISFHDRAGLLERILNEYPQIEVVQLQLNYFDFDDAAVQSGLCYDVCCKYGKKVIVMEPVKGGSLAKLPEKAAAVLDALHGGSYASYALRFAAGFENVMMVLSGMGNLEMVQDNVATMKQFVPLDNQERDALRTVCDILKAQDSIPCTSCRYCIDGCPRHIAIPELFACLNAKKAFNTWSADYYYKSVCTLKAGKASDCIRCGTCETVCPQHLPIRTLLEKVAETFEKSDKQD